MLVEFMRTQVTQIEGEDDVVQTVEHRASINPLYVSAVIESIATIPPVVVIRMSDGRGLKVRGSYSEVVEKLRASGGDVGNAQETI